MRRLVLVLVVFVASSQVEAQESGSRAVLRGTVRSDSSETPLGGAEVAIPALGIATRAEPGDGSFRLADLAPGTYTVVVRMLGYTPVTSSIRLAAGDSVQKVVHLARTAVPIAPVDVKAEPVRDRKLATFEAHMRAGTGRYLTGATLDSLRDLTLGDILASRLVGAYVVDRVPSAWVATRRGVQSVMNRPSLSRPDMERGAEASACYAAVYLDGVLMYGGHEGEGLFDINSLTPSAIAGIEFYPGGSGLPPELKHLMPTCGAIVIWTR